MTGSGGQSPAEHHLGDRLAALVDGELGHDSRERVLAHLATCWKCKAEADAQRRLKSVFAEAAAPPLSNALLARLQNLPVTGPGGDGAFGHDGAESVQDGRQGPGGPGKDGSGARAEAFALFPAVTPWQRDRGFRVHDFPDPSRGASRGRRFAFAAAGAVSLAAFALTGAQPLASVGETSAGARSEDSLVSGTTLAVRQGPVAPAAPAAEVSLLRPSSAALLPPLARAGLPAGGTPVPR
ncbi:anti-sigma factor family protein [Streptomyces sp. NPDC002537]